MPALSCVLMVTFCWPTTWDYPICTAVPLRWRAGNYVKPVGLDDPVPEHFPKIAAAADPVCLATWLFGGVVSVDCLLVYHLFFKAVGLLLLGGAGMVYCPSHRQRAEYLVAAPPGIALVQAAAAVPCSCCHCFILILPWQQEVASPAVLGALQSQGLYAPASGEVAETLVHDGQQVRAGQVLARLRSSILDASWRWPIARERPGLASLATGF
jgi:putative peptide zinc metalloprotease protein